MAADSKLRSLLEQKKKRDYFAKETVKIVEQMLGDVSKDFFLKSCQVLSQGDYEDITIERSLIELCGYPLCRKELTEVPRQQFRISLKAKCVYDITERKRFCSNMCFKSSKYLSQQLSTEPRWLLSTDSLPEVDITLLPVNENSGSAGEIVPLVTRISLSDVEPPSSMPIGDKPQNAINSCVSSRELQKLADKTESLNLTITEKSNASSNKKVAELKKRGKYKSRKSQALTIADSAVNTTKDAKVPEASLENPITSSRELSKLADNVRDLTIDEKLISGTESVNKSPKPVTVRPENAGDAFVLTSNQMEQKLKQESNIVHVSDRKSQALTIADSAVDTTKDAKVPEACLENPITSNRELSKLADEVRDLTINEKVNSGANSVNNSPKPVTVRPENVGETFVPTSNQMEHKLKQEFDIVRDANQMCKTEKARGKRVVNSAIKPVERIQKTLQQWVTVQTLQYLRGINPFLMENDILDEYTSFIDDISDNEDVGTSKKRVSFALPIQDGYSNEALATNESSSASLLETSLSVNIDVTTEVSTIVTTNSQSTSEIVVTNESKSTSTVPETKSLVNHNLKTVVSSTVAATSTSAPEIGTVNGSNVAAQETFSLGNRDLNVAKAMTTKSVPRQVRKKKPSPKKRDVNVEAVILPKVDSVSQISTRRQIVESKLRDVLIDILEPIGLLCPSALTPLVKTFNLAPTNIIFKPAEQLLMAVVLLLMMSRKDEELKRELNAPSSQKYLAVLLKGFGISVCQLDDMVSNSLNEPVSAASSSEIQHL